MNINLQYLRRSALILFLALFAAPACAQSRDDLINLMTLIGEIDGFELDFEKESARIAIDEDRFVTVLRQREGKVLELRDDVRRLDIDLELAEVLSRVELGALLDRAALLGAEAGLVSVREMDGLGRVLIASDGRVYTGSRVYRRLEPAVVDAGGLARAVADFLTKLEARKNGGPVVASWRRLMTALENPEPSSWMDEGDELAAETAAQLVRSGFAAELEGEDLLGALAEVRAQLAWRTVTGLVADDGSRLLLLQDAIGRKMTREEREGSIVLTRTLSLTFMPWVSVEAKVEFDAESKAVVLAELRRDEWLLGRFVGERFESGDEATGAEESMSLPGMNLPPHVVLLDLDGDPSGIATASGLLSAPDLVTAEDFMTQAAAALPDRAHLDLIGEYFFDYVHDSPDPTRPTLIGTSELSGEIHQDSEATLARALGGVCFGDCDDLAELYQVITRKQGRLSHVTNLPRHAACVWGREEGGEWIVEILQTGPPQEHRAATLPDALRLAYEEFGEARSVDPDRLGVLLRFEGDNTRSPWALGWRIFVDEDYAEKMIDIQRDWHMHTYGRAEAKVLEMIEAGDDDAANWRELAGLQERTQDFAGALESLRKAGETSERVDPELELRRLHLLHLSGMKTEFRVEMMRFLEDLALPRGGERSIDPRMVATLLQAGTIASLQPDLRIEVARILLDTLVYSQPAYTALEALVATPPEVLEPRIKQMFNAGSLELTEMMASLSFILLEKIGRAPAENRLLRYRLAQLGRYCEGYYGTASFFLAQSRDEVMVNLAQLGLTQRAMLGDEAFDRLLDGVEAATELPEVLLARPRAIGLDQGLRDLAFIKNSPMHALRIGLVAADEDRETAEVRRTVSEELGRARAAWKRLEVMDGTTTVLLQIQTLAEMAGCLLTGDFEGFEAQLGVVADLNDRRFRDEASDLIGELARHLSEEDFAEALSIWHRRLRHAPLAFALAWKAAESSPDRAIQAGRAALAAYPERQDFVEELEFMTQRLRR